MLNKFFISFMLLGFLLTGCKEEKKDNTTSLLALAILSQSSSKLSPTATKNTGVARNSAAAAISSASRAARSGTVAFFDKSPKSSDMEKLFSNFHSARINKMYQASKTKKVQFGPSSLATGTGGMTCTSTGCEGTLNGTVTCPSGGTVQLTNVTTKLTFASDPNDPMNMGFDTTMKGQMTLNKCASNSANYLDYPNYLAVIGTGTLTVDAKSGFKLNSFSMPEQTTQNFNVTMTEDATVSSNDFKADANTTLKLENLKSTLNVTIDSKGKNIQITQATDSFTFKGDYEDTLTGSFTTSGTVNGESANTTLNYDKSKVYKYSVNCTFNFTTQASDCKVAMQ